MKIQNLLIKRVYTTQRNPKVCFISIGDELLSGLRKDKNLNYLGKSLFEFGLDLNQAFFIRDDKKEINKTLEYTKHDYDYIFTCGGVGPNSANILYKSLAELYQVELSYNQSILDKMEMTNQFLSRSISANQLLKRKNMAKIPICSKVLFPTDKYWLPIIKTNNILSFPGIPMHFKDLLDAFLIKNKSMFENEDRKMMYRKEYEINVNEQNIEEITKYIESIKIEGVKINYNKIQSNEKVKKINILMFSLEQSKIDSIKHIIEQKYKIKNVREYE